MLPMLVQHFAAPPAAYRPMMFWVWNGEVTRERIDADIADMKAKGCGGFFIHPMGESFRLHDFLQGIAPPYLSDEYMELVKYAVERAETEGLYAWLYDEGGWPSGTAQGKVTEGHPEFRGKVLTVVRVEPGAQGPPPEGTVASLLLRPGQVPQLLPADQPPKPPEGATVLHFVQQPGGYPVDMMDPAAVRRFIEVTHERYREYVGEHFGNTVPGIFTDEPRVGGRLGSAQVPWTPRMLEAFEADHGYDLRPWLPLLFSEEATGVDLADTYTEANRMAVRCAFFDTWTRLHREAYWDRINAWCHEHGLLHVGHVGGEDTLPQHLGGGFGEYFRTAGTLDGPGVDAIWRQLWPGQPPLHFPVLAASAAAQKAPAEPDAEWPRGGLAFTESFGVYGFGLTFAGMKWVTDYQFVRGINVMCPMARSMRTEGGRLYRTMDHMGPGNPLWEHYASYADYVGRLSVMCRAGQRLSAIAVYYPIESLWATEAGKTPGSFETICGLLEDQQLGYDIIGGDALLAAEVEDELLACPGASYEIIIVPEAPVLRASVVRKLADFRAQGGRVVFLGEGPEWVVGGPEARPLEQVAPALTKGAFTVDLPKELDRLMAAFGGSSAQAHVLLWDGFSGAFRGGPWLDRFAGRRLVAGTALLVPEDNLGPFAMLLGLTAPRVRLGLADPVPGVRLMTRALDRTTIHLLVNEKNEDAECELVLLADEPLRLETWDPDTGTRTALAAHDEVAEATSAVISLAPRGSVVLVALPPDLLPEPEAGEPAALAQLLNIGSVGRPAPVSAWEIRDGSAAPLGELPSVPETPAAEQGRWDTVPGLESFSGTMAYRLQFQASAEWQERRVVLELEDVRYVAEVWVNGVDAGRCLWEPYVWEIGALLREGENELTIHVTNTLANQALRPDVIEEAKARGWWNTYCRRSEPMMRESLPSGVGPAVRLWLSEAE